MTTTKKILAISLVAAISGAAIYAYIQKERRAKRKNVPISFI